MWKFEKSITTNLIFLINRMLLMRILAASNEKVSFDVTPQ